MSNAQTMAVSGRLLDRFRLDREGRTFLNWLVCWIVLPNLPFLPVTLLGGPPRYGDIMICAVTGLIARRLPVTLRIGVFLLLMTYLVISFISMMFNLRVIMILTVARLVLEMNPANSIEYVVGAMLVAVSCGLAIWLLRKDMAFSQPKWLLAAAGLSLSLSACDLAQSHSAKGAYGRSAPDGAPFTSATSQVDLLGLADGRTDIMVVMVEAMGTPVDPALSDRFDAIWQRPELKARYDIVSGQTPFYGSTTSGEMRELCLRWGDYDEIGGPQPDCLPAQLARRGYTTASYHAYHSIFFDRDRWYPQIGFQKMSFFQELMKRGASFCPSVFSGTCDHEIPSLIADDLAQTKGPHFTYWLTLNSHLPIVGNDALGTSDCARLDKRLDAEFRMVCRLFAIWDHAAQSLSEVIMRDDFSPTHILIVGDHRPPFTQQQNRLQFDSENVPWVLLRYKGSRSAQ